MIKERNSTEIALVLALREGDKSAVEKLYDDYSPALYGVIRKIILSEQLAEEVLQDVFVKIWNNIDKYDASKGSFFTWIQRIARNLAIDAWRQKKRQGENQDIDLHVNTIDTQQQHSIPTDTIGLKSIVGQLKPEHRELIDLLYFKGYTHQEAADELDMPLGTLKTRVRAALVELRKIFVSVIVFLIILKIFS